jgi:hypothetical protein
MQGVAVLRGLRVLRVAYNGLTSLEGLGRFTALETLDAGYNSIRELGTSLHSCVGLKELILGGWVLLKQSSRMTHPGRGCLRTNGEGAAK